MLQIFYNYSYIDGVSVITGSEKTDKTRQDVLELDSSYQLGYMKSFFKNTIGEWYDLIPRFDDSTCFSSNTDYYYLEPNEPSGKHFNYLWFNPKDR